MPVWHELTKDWRRDHDLVVLGITQEQHPDRCRLFAQWKGLDFPILWDPFNVTRSKVVPRMMLVDEYGVLVSDRASPQSAEAFAKGERDVVEASPSTDRERLPEVAQLGLVDGSRTDARVVFALSELLWRGAEHVGEAVDALTAHVARYPDDAVSHFRLGVAHRMRHDSKSRKATDFQAAVDHWSAALARDPSQYIWRRRIQQYGPLLDKPYPFYDWVARATAEVTARGDEPVELPVSLSRTERLGRSPETVEITESPDPDEGVPFDDGSWLDVVVSVVPDTAGRDHVLRLHVTARPGEKIHWNNEVEPPVLWVESTDDDVEVLPAGQRGRLPPVEISDEDRAFDVELRAPEGTSLAGSGHTVNATLFFHACEEDVGICIYLRRDIEITL